MLRQAFADHGGAEVDTHDDAFLVAFARAKNAMAAVADAPAFVHAAYVHLLLDDLPFRSFLTS
jgi:class 3 adenylate cyclase